MNRKGLASASSYSSDFLTTKSLILAQNERWRRGLGMQVERCSEGQLSEWSGERVSSAWETCPRVGDNLSNEWLIPNVVSEGHPLATKGGDPKGPAARGWSRVPLASW